jgi:cytochrome P450
MSGTKSDRCPNIFDLYLNHNIRAAKEGRVSDIVGDLAIIGVLIGTQFAGSDTSQAGSTSGLTFIAEDQNLQQKVLEACKDGNSDQIIENQTMHKFTLEILRFCNPVPGLIPRVAIGNFEINGIKIKKGDWICGPIGASWAKPDVFGKDYADFNIERHTSKSGEFGMDFIPFSYGKRNCIGRNMGEIMVKILTGELIRRFEIKNPAGYERMFTTRGVVTVKQCTLGMRIR